MLRIMKMQSRIKFRIWHKTEKKFIFTSGGEREAMHNVWLNTDGKLTSVKYPNVEVDEMLIQFSTGKQDKNNREIYEGDIIEAYFWFDGMSWKPKEKVLIAVRCFMDSNIEPKHGGGPDGCIVFEDMEIVGHIYDGKTYELYPR